MSDEEDVAFAAVLRERATALYRRADHMPLRHGDDSIDRHIGLKERANRYMARAEELDPIVLSVQLDSAGDSTP